MASVRDRVFVFLQGPHGPFFRRLARTLTTIGARCERVAVNRSDEAEWGRAGPLHRFNGDVSEFHAWLEDLIERRGVTDIVLYGDARPIHRIALDLAKRRNLTSHCFEEGYIRPSWVTYERTGTNGYSPLMSISLPRVARSLGLAGSPDEAVPATWGDYRQHQFYSALYYANLLVPSWRYRRFRSHREPPLRECARYWYRTAIAPLTRLVRGLRQWRLLRSGKTYHLVLLQLSFDASMSEHSDYNSTAEFVEDVIDAFAEGATRDEHLVFKAHPFEDGRERLQRVIREVARDLGIAERVIFIDGGTKLAALLDRARSAITINSTAAQQALWRGLPVAALGRAIYRKPGLVSEQTLDGFFRHPRRPDLRSYWLFRRFLMETSQIPGSFYADRGIDLLLDRLPGVMLDPCDPYDRVLSQTVEPAAETGPRPTLIATG